MFISNTGGMLSNEFCDAMWDDWEAFVSQHVTMRDFGLMYGGL